MEPFLKETLRQIIANQSGHLEDITLVFNNRRPALFVKHYMRELLGDAFFLPNTIVFDDLIGELGDTELVQNEFLLFELYGIHRRVNPQDTRTLEQFIPMADMMLSDFSEVDRYMVDVKDIYGYLKDLKEIGEWQIDGSKLTQFQKDYLRFYKSIYTYYTELNALLDSRGQAYYGKAYRKVAENIDTILDVQRDKMLYFIGFNALSKCEKRIIETYIRRGIGKFIPDGDKYYVDDESQEAGYFLREHRELSMVKEYKEHFAEVEKVINIVKAPDNVTQAKYAGSVLREITSSKSKIPISETALVLGDEGLLPAVLNSLPDSIGQANITMGIPFIQTEMHSLALTLLSLYANSRLSKHTSLHFYHKDLLDLLGNKYICGLTEAYKMPERAKQYLTEKNVIYGGLSDLETMFATLKSSIEPIRFIFEADQDKPFDILNVAKQLTERIDKKGLIDNKSKEKAAIESLEQIIDYIETLKAKTETEGDRPIPIEDICTLKKIYLRIAQRHSISFIGKPLSGLQILGVLETRCLDFRRVILLSANEGVIPSTRNNNTLIPNSMKRLFKMPTYYEKDAVYAYNFYHLLQRAEEVYIVSSNDGSKDSESRFVQQLRAELSKRYKDTVTLNELTVMNSNVSYGTNCKNYVEKTAEIVERLHKKRYSPSALNNYIACPLRFYYENLLNIRKGEEISDTIESNDLGTVIHQCLEDIYKPFIDKPLEKEALIAEIEMVPGRIEDLLEKFFTNGEIHEGKTDLMRSVAISQVVHFLKQEIAVLEEGHRVEIVQLEETMDTPVELNLKGRSSATEVRFDTKADRIDRIDGRLRVIDYKSGRVKKEDINVESIDPENWQKLPAKWFQVMFYAWYYTRIHKVNEEMLSGLCPLQHLGGAFIPASLGDNSLLTKENMSQFEQLLGNILADIMDANTPFTAKPSDNCKYCPIGAICPKIANSDTGLTPQDGEKEKLT